FILLILVAGLFRWLTQRAEGKRKRSGDPNESARQRESVAPVRGGEQTEEERVRRFLEALGQPTGSKPPSKIAPRKLVEPRPVIAHFPPITPTLPPLTTAPPPLPEYPAPAPQPMTPAASEQIAPARTREPAVFEVAPVQPTTTSKVQRDAATRSGLTSSRNVARDQMSLAARLATADGLRDAIVLREIFGPPRSLQTIDGMGGL
ncbi:MAG: hypothetical protein ACR2MF_03215, partial [Chthoniobacterales bacterium]